MADWPEPSPTVFRRWLEFLGGSSWADVSAVFVDSASVNDSVEMASPERLPELAQGGREVFRSLWDRRSLIVDLDMEYVNFDQPAEAYWAPERAFLLMQPVARAAREVMGRFGLRTLELLSGRGPHFLWRVRRGSSAYRKLQHLGRLDESLRQRYAAPQPPAGDVVDPDLGEAFSGLGRVMEYLAHRVKASSAACAVPVELSEVLAGPLEHGREIVSVDVSAFGDPLHTRALRMPFSPYLKPFRLGVVGEPEEYRPPPQLSVIPRQDLALTQAIRVMRNPELAAELAVTAETWIPDASDAMEDLIEEYLESELAFFHEGFYGVEAGPPETWPRAETELLDGGLPLCAATILEQPNDLLLKLSGIRRLVRVLMALGWHPRHISGLVRSRYLEDHGWGGRWERDDAATRADFFVRLFAGLVATGVDQLVDFNCQSAKEEQFCFHDECSFNLADYQRSLQRRKDHGRLVGGPFHGLFLPDEPP